MQTPPSLVCKNFTNGSKINLHHVLSTVLKVSFIFARTEILLSKGGQSQRGEVGKTCLEIFELRAC